MTTAPGPMLAAEIRKHPNYGKVFWDLKTEQEGLLSSSVGGSTADIAYKVYGSGPRKIVFISGLGGIIPMWQRQVKDFACDHPEDYAVLVYDNRGMGRSSASPFSRFTTSTMAGDVVNLLNHIGWTDQHQVNVVGCSMGGMIAQEVAVQIPDRINSLTLLSTASKVVSAAGFSDNMYNRIRGILAPSIKEDERLRVALECLYTLEWLDAPDTSDEHAEPPMRTNRDRAAAMDLAKRDTYAEFSKTGYILQMLAAKTHEKTDEHLKELGDKLGRSRIMVVHGSEDRMLAFSHGVTVASGLGLISKIDEAQDWSAKAAQHPDETWNGKEWSNWTILPNPEPRLAVEGAQPNYRVYFIHGQAHMMALEMRSQFNTWLIDLIDSAESLN